MPTVVSISLGSAARDHEAEVRVGGERFRVRRIGTGGDVRRAAALIRAYDGRVAAIGLGGVDIFLGLGRRRWALPTGRYLAAQALRTPVVDGRGWKAAVEPVAVAALPGAGFPLAGRTTLVSSALDRFWLAQGLEAAGCRIIVGDAYFALGVPIFFPSLRAFAVAARPTMPALRLLPLGWLYPWRDGAGEGGACGVLPDHVAILAGDFLLLRRRLPADLRGRDVVASTLTAADLAWLRERRVGRLATLAPPLNGRWFGANVWEAMAVAAAGGRRPEAMRADDYVSFWRAAGGSPWLAEWRNSARAGV